MSAITKIAWIIILITWYPRIGWSQNYNDITLFDFLSHNTNVIDSVTGNKVDHHAVYDAFIKESTDDSGNHHHGILIDLFKKVSDGYEISSLTENSVLRKAPNYVVDSSERDFSELITYHVSQFRSSKGTRDTVYLFSRPRYYNQDEPKLYDHTELAAGSYRLSKITVQGVTLQLSDCFSKQILDILPNSYAILHYRNGYQLECADLNSNFYRDVFGTNKKIKSVKITGRGPIKYILVEDFIYLFTVDKEFLCRLKIENTDSELILIGENLARFEYKRTEE